MNRTITWVAVAALLALAACNKKSENPPAGNASGSAMMGGSGSATAAGSGSAMAAGSGSAMANAAGSGSAMATGSAAPPASVDVPTEMDFEDNATAKITDKNVEAEVQAMEKELEQK